MPRWVECWHNRQHMQTRFNNRHRCQGNIHPRIRNLFWDRRNRPVLYDGVVRRWHRKLLLHYGGIKMKLFSIFPILGLMSISIAYADCVETTKTYTSCNAGYYLSSGDCKICPGPGTSATDNANDITSCYVPSGQSLKDSAGIYTYTKDCYYDK